MGCVPGLEMPRYGCSSGGQSAASAGAEASRGSGLAPIPSRSQVATVRKRASVCGNLRPRMIARFAAVILASSHRPVSRPHKPPCLQSQTCPRETRSRIRCAAAGISGSLPVPGLQARVPVLTGFDVEIERALERILGVEILLPEIAWNAHLEALADGTADIAAGATKSEARSAFAYF